MTNVLVGDERPARGYATTVALVVGVLAIGLSLFSLWTSFLIPPPALQLRAAHVAFVVPLTFLLIRVKRSGDVTRPSRLDLLFAVLALIPCVYIWVNYDDIVARLMYITDLTTWQIILGTVLTLLVLEGARRALGAPLPILAVMFMALAYFGDVLPGPLQNKGYSVTEILETLYLLPQGLFGDPTAVSAKYLVIFILFGAFLTRAGAGTFFTDIASSLVGNSRGGIAKVAVLSSSLFGTVSGASVANVAVTGTFTIPAMIRAGFPRNVAGAIEAVASSGGSLMPPVMGAAAFLVVEFTGVPYSELIKNALLAALLYYVSIFAFIHFEALKRNIGSSMDETPPVLKVLKAHAHVVVIPTAVMVWMILSGFSPTYSAFWAIGLIVVASWLRRGTRLGPKKIVLALREGAVRVVPVAMACVCAGIVTGMVLLTGLGLRMSTILLNNFGSSLFMLLFVTMLAAIVLGMGMPSPAAYVICATLLAPALVEAGVSLIAAHLFVFYFAILSTITPPVALAAYTAASISGGNPMVTGFYAFRYGIVSFIIPYLFVFHEELLMIGDPLDIIVAFVTGVIGVIGIAVAMQGFWRQRLSWPVRAFVLAGSLLLATPGMETNLIGFGLLVAAAGWATFIDSGKEKPADPDGKEPDHDPVEDQGPAPAPAGDLEVTDARNARISDA